MSVFTDTHSNFIKYLQDGILRDLSKCSSAYERLSVQRNKYTNQLCSLVPSILLSDYLDLQCTMAYYELCYNYQCGIRDSCKECVEDLGDRIEEGLSRDERYEQLRSQVTVKYSELKAVLPSEYCDLLDTYIEMSDIVLGVEKQYCYARGMRDKIELTKQLSSEQMAEVDRIISLYL